MIKSGIDQERWSTLFGGERQAGRSASEGRQRGNVEGAAGARTDNAEHPVRAEDGDAGRIDRRCAQRDPEQ